MGAVLATFVGNVWAPALPRSLLGSRASMPLPLGIASPRPPQTPPIGFPIALYAHRGGPLEMPEFVENTLPSFRHAAKLGVDLLELDVQLTNDGHVVVFHDRDMGRMFGWQYKGKCIAEFSYAELPNLSSAHHAAQDAAQDEVQDAVQLCDDSTLLEESLRVPLLEDVFREFPNFPIQVDIKVRTPGLVEATLKLVNKYPGRSDMLLLGSFLHDVNTMIYKSAPHIPLFTSADRLQYLIAMHRLGMLSYTDIYESAIVVPWYLPLYRPLGLYMRLLDQGFFSSLNARGVAVIVYGHMSEFNTEAVFRLCKAAGANAICTDKPSLLQQLLEREGPLAPLPWLQQQQ